MSNILKLYNLEKKETIDICADSNLLIFVLHGEIVSLGLEEGKLMQYQKSIFMLPIASKLLITSSNKSQILIVSFEPATYFSAEYTQRLLLYSNTKCNPSIDLNDCLMPFLHSVSSYIENDINMMELSEVLRTEMFIVLKSYYSEEDLSRLFSPILNADLAFKQAVMSNCLRVNTLDELASLMNYSKSGFIKKFHRYFGISPYKWILDYKVKRILQEIVQTNKQFHDIADDHGISNLSYFYTFCKKHFGKSPSDIRKDGGILL